jgi:hypothetical protein
VAAAAAEVLEGEQVKYHGNPNAHRTAIKRTRVSLPVRWLLKRGYLMQYRTLDYGCGYGMDCDTMGWDGYDPHYRPHGAAGLYRQIVSVYVANVLRDEEVEAYLGGILNRLQPGGTAYIAVRRDVKNEGWTARGDTYQTNRKLDLPLLHEQRGAFAIYTLTKGVA